MDKHKLYGLWHRFKNSSIILIIVMFVVFAAASVYELRANNLQMVKLRQAVYATDEQNGDVEAALKNLREYVYGHMNTNLRSNSSSSEPPIQLAGRFNRALSAEQARVAALGGANQVYVDAQRECEVSSLPLTARAQCMQNYITANGNGVPQLNLPPKEAYTFDFLSPFWSPDLAGWSIVLASIIGLLLLARLIAGFMVARFIKN
jgi:hypothetical protein